MTALAASRMDPKTVVIDQKYFPLAAGQHAYQGGLACIDTSTGTIKVGATSTTLIPLGLFVEEVDNSGGSGSVNANVQLFKRVIAKWMNNDSGGGAVAATDLGKQCYIKDDQTVTITSTGASKAGRVLGVGTVDGVSSVLVDFSLAGLTA